MSKKTESKIVNQEELTDESSEYIPEPKLVGASPLKYNFKYPNQFKESDPEFYLELTEIMIARLSVAYELVLFKKMDMYEYKPPTEINPYSWQRLEDDIVFAINTLVHYF